MSLSKEWLNRITHWNNALWQICYEPLGSLKLSGFVTRKQLSFDQAMSHAFHPMPVGSAWGAQWEYGWFKCDLALPEKAAGRRIVLYMNPAAKPPEDGECLVWANGKIIGAYGWATQQISLTRNGIPGASYAILAEAYAGHGPFGTHDVPVMGGGPVRFGHPPFPEPGKTQVVVGESHFGIWREQVYQLALDFTTLFELRNRLDDTSLRVSEIDQGLKDVTLLIDLEQPEPEMLETINAARERLRPLLACVNGSTSPTFFAFGHAHIDAAWLWPWAETERKIARTVANQLSLMEEYPEYRFLQSQPQLYLMLKLRYPELYERFKAAMSAGKVIPDGAMWVEADTNITGGESLFRQILYAKQFFQEEFAQDIDVMWLPDVFGYSGALPQIMLKSGINSFTTSKITWTYHGGEPFPYNIFLWEGIDGSCIPSHIYSDYNSHTRPGSLLDRWETRLQKDGIRSMLLPFGWGDGGGGPTRDHLEFLARAHDLEGLPRVKLASPAEFFADLKKQGLPTERYVGELYFQAHRGTYTSQARTKLLNRRSEFALREAELWSTIAHTMGKYPYSCDDLKLAWRQVLQNQFHDILPGSSIHRVYDEVNAAYSQVIDQASKRIKTATAALLKSKARETLTVFNSLSWQREELIESPRGPALVTIPPCGWTTVQLANQKLKPAARRSPGVKVSESGLENELLKALFNERGELISLVDKETGIEMMAGAGNRFCLYKDIPARFDAWDVDSMTEKLLMATDEPVHMEMNASNPLQAKIKLTRKVHNSTLTQWISLRRKSRRIDFETTVDWKEKHKLLKVAFPVNIHANEAIHEIQFGNIRRPNHRSRQFDIDRFEVCQQKWTALAEEQRGVAILNDCKYGINVLGNSINLTLLKSALAPDPTADQGINQFTYAIYYWNGSFGDCDVIHEAYDLNNPVIVVPGSAGEASIFNIDAENIIIETVKLAENGSDDIILRLYESKRSLTHCTLVTPLKIARAVVTDMLEKPQNELSVNHGKIDLEFLPFEIKTIRLTVDRDQ